MKYKCILADPPWAERGGGKSKRGADRHYPLMSTKEITALPVRQLADEGGSHLWLWVTNNFLPQGLEVMQAWGFRYVTNMCWGKVSAEYPFAGGPRMGLGQYLRGAHELLLFGVRGGLGPGGTPYGQKPSPVVPSLLLARRARHSRKPPQVHNLISSVSPGPRLELFARERRTGWDCLGNETEGGDIRDAMLGLIQPSLWQVPCRGCGQMGDTVWCQDCSDHGAGCPHGNEPGECNACDVEGDLAFDSMREDALGGRR